MGLLQRLRAALRRPTRPTGVRIIRPDGEVVDCDHLLIYQGVDADGLDRWVIPASVGFRVNIDQISATIPGKASLQFAALLPPEQPCE